MINHNLAISYRLRTRTYAKSVAYRTGVINGRINNRNDEFLLVYRKDMLIPYVENKHNEGYKIKLKDMRW